MYRSTTGAHITNHHRAPSATITHVLDTIHLPPHFASASESTAALTQNYRPM